MDANSLGFPSSWFDIAICGFMGWDDCFDFTLGKFTHQECKAKEVWRVLRRGGKFVCCAWQEQEDVAWMEEAVIRHYPAVLADPEYLEGHPIGMAYENAAGYEVIFNSAGFNEVEIFQETITCVSSDEEEWWQQMLNLGWDSLLEKIKAKGMDQLQNLKESVFKDLQFYKRENGIYFNKVVFFVSGVK